jgi:hypothetical protein
MLPTLLVRRLKMLLIDNFGKMATNSPLLKAVQITPAGLHALCRKMINFGRTTVCLQTKIISITMALLI